MYVDDSRTADDLNRPEGNSLKENYTHHDVGEAHLRRALEDRGLEVEEWGIDMRDADEGLIFDDRMDLKVYRTRRSRVGVGHHANVIEQRELVCIIDVKTKTSKHYLGSFNERHYHKYADHAESHDVPVLVWFALVDGDEVAENFFTPIVGEFTNVKQAGSFPDGNKRVECTMTYTWKWFDGVVIGNLS